jgi:hypothetical protein
MIKLIIFIFSIFLCSLTYGDDIGDAIRQDAKALAQMNTQHFGTPYIKQNPANLRYPGEVGYASVVTMLPQGTTLRAFVLVSGDRRYVRFSGSPMFSGVTQVHTFTYMK